MKFRTITLDCGFQFGIGGVLLGRRHGIRIFIKRGNPPPPRRVVLMKRTLKESFPWKKVKPLQFGKYAVRAPSKIKAQRALETLNICQRKARKARCGKALRAF